VDTELITIPDTIVEEEWLAQVIDIHPVEDEDHGAADVKC